MGCTIDSMRYVPVYHPVRTFAGTFPGTLVCTIHTRLIVCLASYVSTIVLVQVLVLDKIIILRSISSSCHPSWKYNANNSTYHTIRQSRHHHHPKRSNSNNTFRNNNIIIRLVIQRKVTTARITMIIRRRKK